MEEAPMTITRLIEEYLDKFTKRVYKKDPCTPKFTVSLQMLNAGYRILATVEHNGRKYTEVLWPDASLDDELTVLYNTTM